MTRAQGFKSVERCYLCEGKLPCAKMLDSHISETLAL